MLPVPIFHKNCLKFGTLNLKKVKFNGNINLFCSEAGCEFPNQPGDNYRTTLLIPSIVVSNKNVISAMLWLITRETLGSIYGNETRAQFVCVKCPMRCWGSGKMKSHICWSTNESLNLSIASRALPFDRKSRWILKVLCLFQKIRKCLHYWKLCKLVAKKLRKPWHHGTKTFWQIWPPWERKD